jgi:hypothetical protein
LGLRGCNERLGKLFNEELYDLYSSQNIIRVTKSRLIRWAGHVAHRKRNMHAGFWWGIQKKRDHLEHIGVYKRIILKWILTKQNGRTCSEFMSVRIGTTNGLFL